MTSRPVLATLTVVTLVVVAVTVWLVVLRPGADDGDAVGRTAPSPSAPAESSPAGEESPTSPSSPTTSPSVSSSPTPSDPTDSSDPAAGSSTSEPVPGASAYVVASAQGVVRRVEGTDTRVTARAASVAWGIDDLVVYETDGAPGTDTEVRAWSPRRDRALPVGQGADGSGLLGAGSLEGRAVALVSETVPGETATDVTDRLVAVDLRDGSRTVYSEGRPSFESGWIAAAVLADGDVVATRQSSVVLQLVRLTPGGDERWSVRAAEDRPADLAVVADEPSIVAPGTGQQRGSTLRVDTYGADGTRTARTRVDLDESLPGRVACRDWYAVDRLACSTDDEPRAVTVRGDATGAVAPLRGAPGAVVTAVASTG